MNPLKIDDYEAWARRARHTGIARLDAGFVADAAGTSLTRATMLLERAGPDSSPPQGVAFSGQWRITEILPTAHALQTDRLSPLQPLSLPGHALLPGLVNSHTHLDLTHIGARPYDPTRGFVGWVELIRRERAIDPDAIRASVRRGVELSLAGGTVAVGDIAGAAGGRATTVAAAALAELPLMGVSYVEFFAIGRAEERGLSAMKVALDAPFDAHGRLRLGLQPHAPNTTSLRAYFEAAAEATRRNMPLATHLAETTEEQDFVGRATGPQREMLERFGIWDDRVADRGPMSIGRGLSPVRHLEPVLRQYRFLLAHANMVDDADIRLLSETRQSVAYCPRAHEYFGHPTAIGPHRYRDMLAAGVNVALGTDSIVNLPSASANESTGGIGVLEEMRLLYTRDSTDPAILLKMATVNGAHALGLDAKPFVFGVGAELAGLVAVPTLAGTSPDLSSVLTSSMKPQLLFVRN